MRPLVKHQRSLNDLLKRQYEKERRSIIEKCEELGIEIYIVGKNDDAMYASPKNFVCVSSKNEMHIGQEFSFGIEEPEIFISKHDYEEFF